MEIACCYLNFSTTKNTDFKQKLKCEVIKHISDKLKTEDPSISIDEVSSFSYTIKGDAQNFRSLQSDCLDAYIRSNYVYPGKDYILIADSLLDISVVPQSALNLLKVWEKLGHMKYCCIMNYGERNLWEYYDSIMSVYWIDRYGPWLRKSPTEGKRAEKRPMPEAVRQVYKDLIQVEGYSIRAVSEYYGVPASTLHYHVADTEVWENASKDSERRMPNGVRITHGDEPPAFIRANEKIARCYAEIASKMVISVDDQTVSAFD